MSGRDLAEGESLIPAIETDFPELSGWWTGMRTTELEQLSNELMRFQIYKIPNSNAAIFVAKSRSMLYRALKLDQTVLAEGLNTTKVGRNSKLQL